MKQLFNDKSRTIIDTNLFDIIQKDELTYYSHDKSEGIKANSKTYKINLSKITTNYDEYGRSFTDSFIVVLNYDSERKRNADYNKIIDSYKSVKNYIPYKREVK